MPLAGNLINMDIFTGAYRISCRAVVGHAGLLAELGNINTDNMDLQDVYISRINHPGEIITSYPICTFRKNNIDFVVLQDRRDGLPSGVQFSQLMTRGKIARSFLTVSSFEIRGEVRHEGKLSASLMLTNFISRYQFVFGGKASSALYPDFVFTGDLILVDSARIGLFCVEPGG